MVAVSRSSVGTRAKKAMAVENVSLVSSRFLTKASRRNMWPRLTSKAHAPDSAWVSSHGRRASLGGRPGRSLPIPEQLSWDRPHRTYPDRAGSASLALKEQPSRSFPLGEPRWHGRHSAARPASAAGTPFAVGHFIMRRGKSPGYRTLGCPWRHPQSAAQPYRAFETSVIPPYPLGLLPALTAEAPFTPRTLWPLVWTGIGMLNRLTRPWSVSRKPLYSSS